MKINAYNNINQLKNTEIKKETFENKTNLENTNQNTIDKVSISSEALVKLNNIESKNNEKIDNIKKLINEGNYNVDYEKLAKNIIDFEKNIN